MLAAEFTPHKIRMCFTCLIAFLFVSAISGCTVKHASLQPGTIPTLGVPSPRAEKYGNSLFRKICKKYEIDSESQQYERLVYIFNQLTKAAEVDHIPWHIYLIDEPKILDIRAVHGNYIFVWSGIMNAVGNDDEFAGLLAYELSHALAHHTDPVKFTLTSEILFTTTELATSIGIMMASQGVIALSGQGWLKWIYTEAADLKPMDLKFSEEFEREATDIALLILTNTRYSQQALLEFWERAALDESQSKKYKRISRNLSPQQRVALIENLIVIEPEEEYQLAKNPTKQ